MKEVEGHIKILNCYVPIGTKLLIHSFQQRKRNLCRSNKELHKFKALGRVFDDV